MRVKYYIRESGNAFQSTYGHLVWERPLGKYINKLGYLGTGREVVLL